LILPDGLLRGGSRSSAAENVSPALISSYNQKNALRSLLDLVFSKPRELDLDSTGFIDDWVETPFSMMSLHHFAQRFEILRRA
jgi:hypothetical protein